MRFITIIVGGTEYEFAASNSILYRSQEYSGVSVVEMMMQPSYTSLEFSRFASGIAAAGIEACEGKRIEKGKMAKWLQDINDRTAISEVLPMHQAIMEGLLPDTVVADGTEEPDPNAGTESLKPGQTSNG